MEHKEDSALVLLLRLSHRYLNGGYVRMKAMGIHPRQLPILKILYEQDGITQNEIARRLDNRPSTVTVSLKRLERAGMVERKQDEKDQRMVRVRLTARGRELFARIPSMIEKNEQRILTGLSDAEICLLKRMLRQILGNLDKVPGSREFSETICKKEDIQE